MGGKKILVIDDSELVSQLLVNFLTEHDFQVEVARDANEGYGKALEFQPQLILLDVQLPDVTGFELLRVLKNRAELKDIPVIMITGTAHSTAEKVRGFQSGADDYVLKPFEMPELLERILLQLRRHEASLAPMPASTPLATPTPASTSVPAENAQENVSDSVDTGELTLREWVLRTVAAPFELPEKTTLPPVALPFAGIVIGLLLGGLALTSGTAPHPVVASLTGIGVWLLLVSVLSVACSLQGFQLAWQECARLMALAGLPVLMKLSGGVVVSACTTLSPLRYSASPALLLSKKAAEGFLIQRLDLFELWAVALTAILVYRRCGASRRQAFWAASAVWAAWLGAAALMRLWGS